MKCSTILAIATVIGLTSVTSIAPAGATDWSWLGNKPYLDCLKLMNSMAKGGGIWGPSQNASQQAVNSEKGRHICNQKYYGHP